VVGADLGGEPTGHLAHRGQQRQGAVGQLHRLVGQAGGAGGQERGGHVRVGGQVEIGEQHLVATQVPKLPGLGLLHLDDQLGPPGLVGRDDVGSCAGVGGIVDRRPIAGAGLDQHA
jgi:hypothetical protein